MIHHRECLQIRIHVKLIYKMYRRKGIPMIQTIKKDLQNIVDELVEEQYVKPGDLFVVGCSTSEVAGKHIGSSGSEEIARALYDVLKDFQNQAQIDLAFQCCEHLNRALCIERSTKDKYRLDEVTVIPVPSAGGSMASHAYTQMQDPVMVEHIEADIGIDIGETMIGMQLKHVAVPLRLKTRYVQDARVGAARTRPKLIGGERAAYKQTSLNNSCN